MDYNHVKIRNLSKIEGAAVSKCYNIAFFIKEAGNRERKGQGGRWGEQKTQTTYHRSWWQRVSWVVDDQLSEGLQEAVRERLCDDHIAGVYHRRMKLILEVTIFR